MEKGVGRNFVSFQNHLFLRFSTTQRSLQLSAEFRSSTECKVSRPLSFTSCFEAASNNAMFWFFVVASARHHGIYGTWRHGVTMKLSQTCSFTWGDSLLCSSLRKQPPHIGRPQERESLGGFEATRCEAAVFAFVFETFLPTKQRSRQADHFDQRLTKAQKCAIGNSRWRSKRVGDKTEQLLVCLGSAKPKWRSTVSRLKLRTLDGWYCYIWDRRTASGISCRRKGWYSSPLENVLWLAFFILIYINTLKNILGLCAEYKGNFFGVWKVFRGNNVRLFRWWHNQWTPTSNTRSKHRDTHPGSSSILMFSRSKTFGFWQSSHSEMLKGVI